MSGSKDYITFYHIDAKIKTIDDLVANPKFKGKGMSVGEVLDYRDENGVSNLERMYEKYRFDDTDDSILVFDANKKSDLSLLNSLADPSSFSPTYNTVKLGTVFKIPVNRVGLDVRLSRNDGRISKPVPSEFNPLVSDKLLDVMERDHRIQLRKSGYVEYHPRVSVWIWCKCLSTTDNHLDGGLIDISAFVHSVSTNKSKVAGKFNISLAPIPITVDDLGNMKATSTNRFYHDTHLVESKNNRSLLNQSFLNKYISPNDIVFIRFDPVVDKFSAYDLGMTDLERAYGDLEGMNFNMIGLVDNPESSMQASGNELRVSISGSDLSKLLTEDSSELYGQRFIANDNDYSDVSYAGGIIRFHGKYISTFQLIDQYLKDQMLFLIDYQSKIKICDGVFDYYSSKNSRSSKIDVPYSGITGGEVEGIWKVIDVAVDGKAKVLRSFNRDIGNAYESLQSQIHKVCREPLIEFYTDTYMDRFLLMARRPIFDKESVFYFLENGLLKVLKNHEMYSDSLSYTDEVYSWYKMDIRFLTEAFGADTRWLIPAKYFDEYGHIWGDKARKVEDPYIELVEKYNGDNDPEFGKNLVSQGLSDLKFVIESSAYLPFTRKGTINIRLNSTIKRGTWVYHAGTGEIFYVDSVTHTYRAVGGMDATTTLNVSRGMVLDHISEYFSVIDLPYEEFRSGDVIDYMNKTFRSWKVNRNVFNSLLRKRQENENNSYVGEDAED